MRKITALLLALMASLATGRAQQPQGKDVNYQKVKFEQFYDVLNALYVDTLDNDKLIEKAITTILADLDPHSSYSSAEEMKAIYESMEGSFSGIGVEFDVVADSILVVNTIPEGPSERCGILPGDRIVAVDGASCVGIARDEVPTLLRGKKGSVVTLGIIRRGEPDLLLFRVKREEIPIHTVDAAYMAAPEVGYIRVNRFASTTTKEFQKAILDLSPKMGLILDLRGNSGGLLDPAIAVSEYFLPAGAEIVSVEGRNVRATSYRSSRKNGFDGRLVVLIDASSASASEIVAGAIQDWDRGVIVGQTSFGKGLVQRQQPLVDGSAVRITIARYHTPSGRVIQRPFTAGDAEGYYIDHLRRSYDDHYADSLNATAPAYLTLRMGRTVFGDGGIRPDVYVPIDTTRNYTYWNELISNGVVNEYANAYLEENRSRLVATYATGEQFADSFKVTDEMLNDLIALGERRDVVYRTGDRLDTLPAARTSLKALIARKIWGTTTYYQILNEADDRVYRRAVELLNNPTAYGQLLLPPAKAK